MKRGVEQAVVYQWQFAPILASNYSGRLVILSRWPDTGRASISLIYIFRSGTAITRQGVMSVKTSLTRQGNPSSNRSQAVCPSDWKIPTSDNWGNRKLRIWGKDYILDIQKNSPDFLIILNSKSTFVSDVILKNHTYTVRNQAADWVHPHHCHSNNVLHLNGILDIKLAYARLLSQT